MPQPFNPGREDVKVTALANLITEKAPSFDGGGVDRLLSSLGVESVQRTLKQFGDDQDAARLQEQKAKFDWYVEQFRKDHSGGAVSEAQVRARFPETVPVIASRVAEAIGNIEARKQFQPVLEEIAGNDNLRLDTNARRAFIEQKRDELLKQVGTGNDFFGAGMVAGIDGMVRQHELNWASETAAYHQKVQAEAFSKEASEGLLSGDPEAALLALDEKYGASSSLNNPERNKLVVGAAVDMAYAGRDSKLLDTIPQRFLNADAKAALEKARVQIQALRIGDFRDAQYLEGVKREEEERKGRLQIIQSHADGKPMDPAQFRDNPALYAFAAAQREQGRIPEPESAGNVQKWETRIWTEASAGKSRTMNEYIAQITADPTINPKDKAPLIARLEKLMEGTAVMKDELVRQTYSDRLGPALNSLEASRLYGVYSAQGRNIRGEVAQGFDIDLRRLWQAHYEEKGEFPRGTAKQTLIDQALARAEARIREALSPESLKSRPNAPAAGPTKSTTDPAAATPLGGPVPLRKGIVEVK